MPYILIEIPNNVEETAEKERLTIFSKYKPETNTTVIKAYVNDKTEEDVVDFLYGDWGNFKQFEFVK